MDCPLTKVQLHFKTAENVFKAAAQQWAKTMGETTLMTLMVKNTLVWL
jgi:hypothetical protein